MLVRWCSLTWVWYTMFRCTLCDGLDPHSILCQVETSSYEEATEAARAGADIIMLDNFDPDELKSVSGKLKSEFPHVILEASGGITAETFDQYLSDSVDVISQGVLTHGYKCLDFSLKVVAHVDKAIETKV